MTFRPSASLEKAAWKRGIHHPGFGESGERIEEPVLDLPEVWLESQEAGGAEELFGADGDAGEIGAGSISSRVRSSDSDSVFSRSSRWADIPRLARSQSRSMASRETTSPRTSRAISS